MSTTILDIENEKKVEIYTNGPWVILRIGNLCFSPLGKRKNCIIPEGYVKKDISHVGILRLTDEIVFITEYYDLSVHDGKFFLHLDDRAHPIYSYAITFRISPEMFAKLIIYTFANAKNISA